MTPDLDPRFARFAETGDRGLRDELVLDNRGLAIAFARRYRARGVPTEDLEQIALEALVLAVDRFDPTHGVRFSTYAARVIDGRLKQWFRDRTGDVSVPRGVRERASAVRTAVEVLAQRLGRSPSVHEIADHLEVAVDDVLLALEAGSAVRAAPLDDDGRLDPVTMPDEDRVDLSLTIPRLLDRLSPTDRRIVELRFRDGLSQSEIGRQVGVSQMQVSRRLRASLEQLRTAWDDVVEGDGPPEVSRI